MAKVKIQERVSQNSADYVYETFISALTEVGFEIWKKRPIAWLCISKQNIEGNQIEANLTVHQTSPISYTLIMTSSTLSEAELINLAEKVINSLNNKLST